MVARKPLAGTVAANVLEHGTGALNIDACRVYATDDDRALMEARSHPNGTTAGSNGGGIAMQFDKPHGFKSHPAGRWPANVVLDESQAAELDRQVGPVHWQATNNTRTSSGWGVSEGKSRRQWDAPKVGAERLAKEGPGLGPSKFFYVAKAGRRERPEVDGVKHPTVKPLALMRHLCRLVTPPGGVILEPFAGSGTTVEAAMLEGFDVVGIEREAEYLPLIGARVQRALEARAREALEAEVRLF